jgi:hypothetical protein
MCQRQFINFDSNQSCLDLGWLFRSPSAKYYETLFGAPNRRHSQCQDWDASVSWRKAHDTELRMPVQIEDSKPQSSNYDIHSAKNCHQVVEYNRFPKLVAQGDRSTCSGYYSMLPPLILLSATC